MGHENSTSDDREKLLAAARALLARGEDKFSITHVCTEAGVARDCFRNHFTGKAALLAQLNAPQEAPAPMPAPESKAETAPEPVVSTPDAWLERRLRVFERALNALEEKADATAREHARAIARLEERLQGLGQGAQTLSLPAVTLPDTDKILTAPAPVLETMTAAAPLADAQEDEDADAEPNPLLLPIEPQPAITLSKAEMAGVLDEARGKVRVVPEPEPPRNNARMRWLAMGALSLVVLFLCVGLTLGDPARARQMPQLEGSGTMQRTVSRDSIQRTIAMADAGDIRAQARLALAYLRGTGVAADPAAAARWSQHAALRGQPVAQYLMGALYSQGEGVRADPVKAFGHFAAAAQKGNIKAMHNLAIAYAEGLGTAKDEAMAAQWFERAAARGYVDSAFDLAVLYERGHGVPQDLTLALKWYAVAGLAGDAPARERVEVLRQQLKPSQALLAANDAMSFTVTPGLTQANALPEF